MKKRTLITVGIATVVVVALYQLLPYAYVRLFPQNAIGYESVRRTFSLALATSQARDFQGAWPASIHQLIPTTNQSYGSNMAVFLKDGTNDSWGHPIVFEPFNPARGYGRIVSYGADGKPGGSWLANDIVWHFGETQKMTFVKHVKQE